MLDLTSRRILITGGGRGIGAACAALCTRNGASVVVADKDIVAATETAARLGCEAIEVDVANETSVAAAVAAAERGGALDGLVHCAGILQRTLPPEELTMREWDIVNQVNFRGAYLTAAAAGAVMASRRYGSIVLIASVAGMRSGPLHAYGPAKAAVISMAECLAAEWGPLGVRVNAVSPGFTLTPALKAGLKHNVMHEPDMVRASAMGRLLTPEEIAAPVLFLLSDLASGITGVNIPADAGYLVATSWQAYGGLRGGR